MQFPNIDPIAFSIGPLAIRWYALAYITGIILGLAYITFLNKRSSNTIADLKPFDDLLTYAVIGIILGGRFGYVLFYNLEFYLQYPEEILKVWHGGMSFHGGLIGSIIAIYLLCRKNNWPFLYITDLAACAAPIGLFFGRIANFINGELYGRTTNSAIGIIFPDSDGMPRHPSQLYEAFLEGFVLFIILFILVMFTQLGRRKGALSGVFLIGYAVSRIIVENFREPDTQLGFFFNYITMGQMLTLPMLILGIYLIIKQNQS